MIERHTSLGAPVSSRVKRHDAHSILFIALSIDTSLVMKDGAAQISWEVGVCAWWHLSWFT